MSKHAIGSKVMVDDPKYPGVWVVQGNGPKNATLVPAGGGRGLRAPHFMLRPASAADQASVTATPVRPYRDFVLGEFVTVRGQTEVYVVIADKGERVNVAVTGGNDNRYVRDPRSWVERVSIDMARRVDA